MKKSSIPLSLLTPALAQTQINRLLVRVSQEMELLQQELLLLPEGRLYIKKTRRWFTFYNHQNSQTRGITKDKDLVHQLARRRYLELLIRFVELFLDDVCCDISGPRFEQLLSEIDTLLRKFERCGLDLDRITMTSNQYIWNSDRESKKKNRRDQLIFPTIGRVYMRTKSEQLLGNLLERLHIPYRYEASLPIGGITYHPDFMIMLPSGRLIIIEHAGRLDLPEYNEDLVFRLQAYNSIGLLIGRDVFFSFEHDTRDEAIAREVLVQAISSTPSDSTYLKKVAMHAGCRF